MDSDTVALPEQWRTVAVVSWVLTAAAIIAVAITSRTIGRSVWWLGPSTRPATPFALLVPLTLVVLPLVAALRRPDLTARLGLFCSAGLVIVALIEFTHVPSVAMAMTVVATASLLSSLALVIATRHYR